MFFFLHFITLAPLPPAFCPAFFFFFFFFFFFVVGYRYLELKEGDESLYEQCLKDLRSEIKTATSSMTSVPKPLKFLRPHYKRIQSMYNRLTNPAQKVRLPVVLLQPLLVLLPQQLASPHLISFIFISFFCIVVNFECCLLLIACG